jgi:hypothetical protein
MTPKQVQKAAAFNAREAKQGDYTQKHQVRLIEFWQEHHGLLADGWCGAFTQKSIDGSIAVDWNQDVHDILANEDQYVDGLWLPWDGPEKSQPRNYKEAIEFFGRPETHKGSDVLDRAWYKANIVECHKKLGNQLPGVPERWWVKTYRRCEPYLREGLRRASLTSPYRIQRCGGFVFRHIRNDPDKDLSMHAFGAAIDFDPDWNYAYQYKRGADVPKAWSPQWLRKWPKGIDEKFVQAMASCGWAWGSDWDEDGRTDDHLWQDPMHMEWIARDGRSRMV